MLKGGLYLVFAKSKEIPQMYYYFFFIYIYVRENYSVISDRLKMNYFVNKPIIKITWAVFLKLL